MPRTRDAGPLRAQASDTQVQARKVKQLEARVAAGQADPADLASAEGALAKMTRQLNSLTNEFTSTASTASR